MDKKLNNLISFREFELKVKIENKPGKTFENVKSFEEFGVDEGLFTGVKKFLTNTTDSDIAEAEQKVMANPAKKALYLKLQQQNPEAAKKYIEFFAKHPGPNEVPEWDPTKKQWVNKSVATFQPR